MTKPSGAIDSQGMWQATESLPEQVAEAADTARKWAGNVELPPRGRVEHIVVLGMGGSGIAGDVLLAAAAPYLSVPVVVVKSYVVPAFVSESSLVFAVSYSGDTEETVEAVVEAQGAGARVIAISGGGQLGQFAQRAELPWYVVPNDIPQPRAALGAMAIPPLFVLEAMGLFPGAAGWVDQAISQLRHRRDEVFGPNSIAEEIAEKIGVAIPVIESSRGLGTAAAQRWKAQINENAKRPSFWSIYPELCHNEVVGWAGPADLASAKMSIVNLRHDTEHPQVARRFDIVKELVGDKVASTIEVRADGEGELAQLMDLVLIGDVVSLHLAAQDGIDPGPVEVLNVLKRRLKRG